MIIVSDILGWVMGRLELSRRAGDSFSKDQFLRELQDGIVKLSRKWPVLQKTEQFTLQDRQNVIVFDSLTRPVNIVSLSTTWSNPLKRLQPQEMRDFVLQANNQRVQFPFSAYPDQPSYWTYHQNLSSSQMGDIESPGSGVELAEASKIKAGNKVTVRYSYIPRLIKLIDKDDTIDIGEEYEMYLKTYVAWKTAIKHRPELVQELKAEHAQELAELQMDHRKRVQSSETDFIHRLLY